MTTVAPWTDHRIGPVWRVIAEDPEMSPDLRRPTDDSFDLDRMTIRYLDGTKWTRDHLAWLHRQRFDSPVLQFTYEADVEQAELLAAHLKRIDQRLALVARDCEYADVINALMCLRGIQVTTGFGLAVEIGDWTRFTGATIGSYLGLVPASNPQDRPDTRARSRRPAANTLASCSSRRRGCTNAPTPGPG